MTSAESIPREVKQLRTHVLRRVIFGAAYIGSSSFVAERARRTVRACRHSAHASLGVIPSCGGALRQRPLGDRVHHAEISTFSAKSRAGLIQFKRFAARRDHLQCTALGLISGAAGSELRPCCDALDWDAEHLHAARPARRRARVGYGHGKAGARRKSWRSPSRRCRGGLLTAIPVPTVGDAWLKR